MKYKKLEKNQDCLIINAGGYTHTSVAIHDALKTINIPIIELHITNIYKREDFRQKSLISKVADGIICGLGVKGYTLALKASINLIKMKIDKKLIKELVNCLGEFNITEIEYQDGDKKLKVSKAIKVQLNKLKLVQ